MAEGLMCTVEESEAVIDSLMEQIPQMFGDTRETETVLGPVIQAGKEAFKAANCAGKLIVFHHNLPVAEAPGKLKNRDDRKVLGTEKEKTVLTPQTKTYNEFGQECVGVGCSVDLFLFNNAYIDVATLSQVCRLSGGQMYKYTYFQADLDGERFISDLAHNISRPVVFDSIMRIRTSTGVRPTDFFGSFFMANTTDMELALLTVIWPWHARSSTMTSSQTKMEFTFKQLCFTHPCPDREDLGSATWHSTPAITWASSTGTATWTPW